MPCVPRSSNVSARPFPNNCSHTRLIIVLAVNGFSLLVNHMARPRRLLGAFFGIGFKACGTAAVTTSPFTSQFPLSKILVGRCMSDGLSIMIGVVGTFAVRSDQKIFLFVSYPGLPLPGNSCVK